METVNQEKAEQMTEKLDKIADNIGDLTLLLEKYILDEEERREAGSWWTSVIFDALAAAAREGTTAYKKKKQKDGTTDVDANKEAMNRASAQLTSSIFSAMSS